MKTKFICEEISNYRVTVEWKIECFSDRFPAIFYIHLHHYFEILCISNLKFVFKFLEDLVRSFFIWQPWGHWGLINFCSILWIWSSFNIVFGLDFGIMYHALFRLEMLEESFPFIIYTRKQGSLSCLGENYDFFFIWENSCDIVLGYGRCSFFQWVYYLPDKPLFFNCHSKVLEYKKGFLRKKFHFILIIWTTQFSGW